MMQAKKKAAKKIVKGNISSRKSKSLCKVTSGIKAGSGWLESMREEIDKELS